MEEVTEAPKETDAPTYSLNIKEDTISEANNEIKTITTELSSWLQSIGKIMLVIGVVLYALSFRTDDASLKEKAGFPIVIGAMLNVGYIKNVISRPSFGTADILEIIYVISQGLGMILLAWGIVLFALAFRNDDSESKFRSVMVVFTGILLISAKAILKLIGF